MGKRDGKLFAKLYFIGLALREFLVIIDSKPRTIVVVNSPVVPEPANEAVQLQAERARAIR